GQESGEQLPPCEALVGRGRCLSITHRSRIPSAERKPCVLARQRTELGDDATKHSAPAQQRFPHFPPVRGRNAAGAPSHAGKHRRARLPGQRTPPLTISRSALPCSDRKSTRLNSSHV